MSRSATIVTGGTGGLGRAVVARFLADGHAVVVPWVAEKEIPDLKNFLDDAGVSREALHLIEADATTDSGWAAALAALPSGTTLRNVVLLVGGFAMGSVEETDAATWDRLVKLNATSVLTGARAVFPALRDAGGGRIVTVAAPAGLGRGAKGMSAYAATKAAVVSLTGSFAKEGGPDGIRVNAVAPDVIDSPANRSSMPDADPTGWLAPSEIAEVIAFLTGEAGGVVNGAILTLTKG